jgi:hypothetical protein
MNVLGMTTADAARILGTTRIRIVQMIRQWHGKDGDYKKEKLKPDAKRRKLEAKKFGNAWFVSPRGVLLLLEERARRTKRA